MKKLLLILILALFYSCSNEPISSTSSQTKRIAALTTIASTKKGIGLSESRGFGNTQLDALGVSWYYSWGVDTQATSKTFFPMCFSLNTIPKLYTTPVLLGFNEPDNTSQSDITVSTALANWNTLVSKSTRLGSPATAVNPLTTGSWLTQFMSANPKVDFVCVHWYKGTDHVKFISDMKAIIALYKKPIWITEFAPQTVASATASPTKYSQAAVNTFIAKTVAWMETEPMVEKYAWHDAKSGTSAVFTSTGALTATGTTYKNSK